MGRGILSVALLTRDCRLAAGADSAMKSHMHRKSAISFLLLAYVFLPIAVRAENEVQRLSASVVVHGQHFAVGDTIQIEAAVKNISSKSFYMYKGLFHSISYIKLFMDGKPLRGYYLAQFGILGPTKDSFFLLQPNEESRILFEGNLEQTTIPDIMRQGHPKASGLFLNFGTSAILIPGSGNYEVTFDLSYSKEASAEAQKQFGFDVWHGTVKSPPVKIMITE